MATTKKVTENITPVQMNSDAPVQTLNIVQVNDLLERTIVAEKENTLLNERLNRFHRMLNKRAIEKAKELVEDCKKYSWNDPSDYKSRSCFYLDELLEAFDWEKPEGLQKLLDSAQREHDKLQKKEEEERAKEKEQESDAE